jgi:L-rhamnose isomerase
LEELKTLPAGAIWDYFCERQGVPVGLRYMEDVRQYERTVLAQRV